MDTLDYLAESIRPSWNPPFRGEIYEYAGKLNLQNGYAVKGQLDMSTLRHLIEPLRAIRALHVRLVSIMGAVQTTKSLIADICNAYWAEHDPGDLLWLLEDDPKAKLYADRALGLFCSIPAIASMLEGVDRHDKTKTTIKLPHQRIAICGLNPGNVQSLSWQRVVVDETWLHPFDGLIRQAMDRAKQYPDNRKIILMGQGGIEDDDHHVEHKQTDQRALHYSCPACGAYQPFELSRERPEDFKPLNPLYAPRSTLHTLPAPPPAPGTYAGLSWDTNEVTKPNGRWNHEEVGKTAHHRCFYCDHRIEDLPEVRHALNDSYAYFPIGTPDQVKIEAGRRYQDRGIVPTTPFPEWVGFEWPAEASIRVPFRELVVKYLRAKTAAEELAYRLPLQEFYQKDRGRPWSEVVEAEYRAAAQELYDPREPWDEENARVLIADCQRDLKLFYWSVFASALDGQARELARGQAESFDQLAAIQKEWKVKDQRVFLDCGYQMTKVLRECVKRGHQAQIKIAGKLRTLWLCWTGLKGSGQELFAHKRKTKNGELKEWKIFSERKFYNVNVGTKDRYHRAPWYEWSNLHAKDLLRDRRDGDPSAPKWLWLPDTLPPTDQNSHFQQMRAEKRKEIWTARGKKSVWELIKETRPNHEWDKGGMLIIFQAIAGIIGAPDSPEDNDQSAPASAS